MQAMQPVPLEHLDGRMPMHGQWNSNPTWSEWAVPPAQLAQVTAELDHRRRTLEAEQATLRNQVEEARKEMRDAAETKEAMEKSVATMVQTMQQALRADAEQGAGVVSTCNQLVQAVAEAQAQTDDLQARNSELRAKKAEAEEDAVRARERLADQQALLAERTAAHAAAKAELQVLNADQGELKKQLAALQEERDGLLGDASAEDAARLQRAVRQLRREVVAAEAAHRSVAAAEAVREEQAAETARRLEKAEARYADSRSRAELLRAQQQELEAALLDLAPRLGKDRERLRLQARRGKDVAALLGTLVGALGFACMYAALL